MDKEVTKMMPDLGKIVRYGPSRLYCPHLDRDDIIETDVLVLGSGAAGLVAANRASRKAKVLVISKVELSETNTCYAQGGIAGVFSALDSIENHLKDTLNGGYGLNREEVASMVVSKGPELIQSLADNGTNFDLTEDGEFNLTREGGHSKARVLHAQGDQTGKEIERSLISLVEGNKNIQLMEKTFAIDLLIEGGNCIGVLVMTQEKRFKIVSAKSVIIASGGLSQIFRETSNPESATGDGVALAYRAGARIEDMEFTQFHPTTLYLAGAPRFLITEAARGEGAYLLNAKRERFMPHYHEKAELAPRDVVSRAILSEQERTRSSSIFLDMGRIGPGVHERFPQISRVLKGYDIDIARDLVPVYPSAHYSIGGIKIDENSRTTIGRLYACGEAAASGFHGANRLGSNSLLESIVFGAIAGENCVKDIDNVGQPSQPIILAVCESGEKVDSAYPFVPLDIADARLSLKSLMWRFVGIVRTREGMENALAKVKFWARYIIYRRFTTIPDWELQNMMTVARLVIDAALTREESRGVHYRSDFQATEPDWKKHIYFER